MSDTPYCLFLLPLPSQAPEQEPGCGHDCRLDSWQLGLLLLHIRHGGLPFLYLYLPGISEEERQQRRGEELDDPACPYHDLLLPVEKEFVKTCMQKNVAARPTPYGLMDTRYLSCFWQPMPVD